MKLLIVEDESSLRELLARALRKEQYVVETASTYAEASDKLAAYSYDCILLDIMLPDGNGLQLLERLRIADKRENVIIISARDSLEDKVLGLKEGADDYLPKPFHLAELSARIQSVIRRSRGGGKGGIALGNVTLDPESCRVEIDGKEVALLKRSSIFFRISCSVRVMWSIRQFWPKPYGGIMSINPIISISFIRRSKICAANSKRPEPRSKSKLCTVSVTN